MDDTRDRINNAGGAGAAADDAYGQSRDVKHRAKPAMGRGSRKKSCG
ncbi:hypothetical protein ACN8ZM_37705 [Burkholderia aenigmatica]